MAQPRACQVCFVLTAIAEKHKTGIRGEAADHACGIAHACCNNGRVGGRILVSKRGGARVRASEAKGHEKFPVLGVSQTKVSCSEKTKAAAVLVTGNNQSKRTHCFSNGHGRNPRPARSGVQASSGPTPSNRHYRAVVLKARLPVPFQVSRAKRVRGQPPWAPHASAGPLQCLICLHPTTSPNHHQGKAGSHSY